MNSFLIASLLLCTLAMSVASEATTLNMQLEVFAGTNPWWTAVALRNASASTISLQIRDARFGWEDMTFVESWGYWTYSCRGVAFRMPMSFRVRSDNGEQLIITNIVTAITGTTQTIDTGVQFLSNAATGAPTEEPTPSPTDAPADAPAEASTDAPTEASESPAEVATDAPIEASESPAEAATDAPIEASETPTEAASDVPTEQVHVHTKAPGTSAPNTEAPTTAPSQAPTGAPTQAPSNAPSQAPTQAPSDAPSAAPTQAPSKAPSAAPTQDPTKAPSAAPSAAPTQSPTKAPTSAPAAPSGCNAPMKIMVPLYVYPGAAWDQLIAASKLVQTVAIINPASGPGNGPNSAYISYMQKMHDAGVEMIGYVYTNWGNRDINAVKADINKYATEFPHVTGIFLDEGATEAAQLPYYKALYDYIMSLPGYKYDVVNPGVPPVQGYMEASTQIVSFEDYTYNLAGHTPPSYASCSNKDHFVAIPHTSPSSNLVSVVSTLKAKQYFGWVYITDGAGGCCTYNQLTTYYPAEAAAVAAANKS